MYKNITNELLTSFNTFFVTNAQVHDYDKRFKHNINVTAHCSTRPSFTIRIQ